MQEQELKELLARINNGTATDEEKAFLESWYLQYRESDEVEYSLDERLEDANQIWSDLRPTITQTKYRRLWTQISVAASILIILSVGGYFALNRQNKNDQAIYDVAPFNAIAILKSGGKIIKLDHAANGRIAQTRVTKSAGEHLTYEAINDTRTTIYDTIQIPSGGRPYTVKLSDGSEITLNTATTLRYPETFSKNREEEIELISGEIYAEIIHNAAAPLRIKAPGQLITDIGTEFNITAYTDEPDSRTTLVKGSVKVNTLNKEKILIPGHQAILTADNLTVATANIMQVIAWKDGLFRFNGEHIDVIMRQLSRWYNIEVKYEGKVTDEVFYGRVARTRKISEVLRILERSQKVHFKIEGRRVTVLSK